MQQNNIFMEETFNYLAGQRPEYRSICNTTFVKIIEKKLKISVNIRENLRLGK